MAQIILPAQQQQQRAPEEPDFWDHLFKGLDVANNIFGIKVRFDEIEAIRNRQAIAQRQEQQRQARTAQLQDPASPQSQLLAQSAKQAGFQVPEGATAEQLQSLGTPAQLQALVLKKAEEKRKLAEAGKPFAETREGQKFIAQKEIEREQRRVEDIEQQKRIRVPGFERRDENVFATKQDAEVIKKANSANIAIQEIGKKIIAKLKKVGPTSGLGLTREDKELTQLIRTMQLEGKELANLGVLTGPDLGLLDETIGGLTGGKAIFLGKDAAISRMEEFLNLSMGKVDSTALARGFVRIGKKAKQQKKGKGLMDAIVPTAVAGEQNLSKMSDDELNQMLFNLSK